MASRISTRTTHANWTAVNMDRSYQLEDSDEEDEAQSMLELVEELTHDNFLEWRLRVSPLLVVSEVWSIIQPKAENDETPDD